MGRRKVILYGQALSERFDVALGLPNFTQARDILSEVDVELPKIDWDLIESKIDHEIDLYTKEEIDFEYKAQIGWRLNNAVTEDLSGELPNAEMSEADFLRKSQRIEYLSRKLTEEIDELVELGTQLIVRPLPKGGLTSAETPDEFYARVGGQVHEPTSECFLDYYSFRRMLDYYSNFSDQNGNFRSIRGYRFDRMRDHSWYETFVRRVVLAFWPTNFPLTVTIPTDTNPHFSSPIILVIGELREHFNQFALSVPRYSDMYEEWTYRQHARLVLKLREEFEESQIFWPLTSLRKYESERSAFAEKEE